MNTEHDPIREWHAQKERAEMVLDVCAKVRSGTVSPCGAALALMTAGVPEALIGPAIQEASTEPAPQGPDLRHDPRLAIGEDLDAVASRAGVPPRVPGEPDAALRSRILAETSRPVSAEGLPTLTVGKAMAAMTVEPSPPVLPPGCQLRPNPNGYQVWGLRGAKRGQMLTSGLDAPTAAERAWALFGTFMSREDYEALDRASEERARLCIDYRSLQARVRKLESDLEAEHDATHAEGLRAERAEAEVQRLRGELADARRAHLLGTSFVVEGKRIGLVDLGPA